MSLSRFFVSACLTYLVLLSFINANIRRISSSKSGSSSYSSSNIRQKLTTTTSKIDDTNRKVSLQRRRYVHMTVEKNPLLIEASSSSSPKIIIAGAPAAGKGTQCEVIRKDFGVVHLSTGDILRAAVKEQSELGLKAKSFMDAGKLVPDELIIGVVCDRLKQTDCVNQGWLLDGFPRTKSQADALNQAGMVPDCFVLLDVPQEVLVERVTGRRTDPVTGKIYHLKFNPPENEEVSARLTQRSDDTEEKIVTRYQDFKSNIDAVKSSYESKMITIDGTQSQAAVSGEITSKLTSILKAKQNKSNNQRDSGDGDDDGSKGGGVKDVVVTALSVAVLAQINQVMTQQLGQFPGLSLVPSSLASMMGLFLGLSALSTKFPHVADQAAALFAPGTSFLTATLLLYFVPPLVVLPLKLNVIRSVGPQKLAALIVLGLTSSIAFSGLLAQSLVNAFATGSKETTTTVSATTTTSSKNGMALKLPPALAPLTACLLAILAASSSPFLPLSPAITTVLQRMVGMTATIGSFLAATQFMSPALKKIVHPVFATATGTLSLLALYSAGSGQLLSTTLTSYYGSGVGLGAGDILASMLTPAVVGFGVQLYHRRQLLLSNSLVVLLTTFLSAVFGVGSSAVLTKYLGIRSPAVAMATLTRSVTTPLGLIGAAAVKADATVAALMISLTGILGATVGPQLLNKLGVKSPLAIGLSVGSSAHGVGSASLADEPLQFASSVLAMTLTGLWTVALLIYPPSRKLSLKLANF